MHATTPHRIRGITLIETMLALALAAILLVTAAPAFGTLIARNESDVSRGTLVTALETARLLAISRNGHVRKTSVEGYVFTTAHWGQRENAPGPLDIEGDTIRRACTETAVTFEVGVIWEPRCGPMAG